MIKAPYLMDGDILKLLQMAGLVMGTQLQLGDVQVQKLMEQMVMF